MPSRLSTGKYLHAEAVSFYLPSPVAETQYLALSYNTDGVLAVIRAAERKRSLAIIQRFPWTMQFQGPHFVRYVVEAAHSAGVPIAVHLDHCIKEEDVRMALEMPFDSIMVDASTG